MTLGTEESEDQFVTPEALPEQFVASEAERLHSEGLQLLAVRIVTDTFVEVTKQIKDLIDSSAPTLVVVRIARRHALGHETPAIHGREVRHSSFSCCRCQAGLYVAQVKTGGACRL